MRYRKLRIVWSVACGIVAVLTLSAIGCIHNNQKATLQQTNAFTRFKKIESIKIEWWFNIKDPVVCTVPEPQWTAFESILEHGIRDPNDVKRDSWGNVELVADGKTHHWALLTIGDNECGLFISQEELWRGIHTRTLDEFVKRYLTERQKK